MNHALEVIFKIFNCFLFNFLYNFIPKISMDFNGIQMISMSKMIIYVLRIIGIFENIKSVTISELKTMLNFSIEDCFPFGKILYFLIFAFS